jgi:hypothetical protein
LIEPTGDRAENRRDPTEGNHSPEHGIDPTAAFTSLSEVAADAARDPEQRPPERLGGHTRHLEQEAEISHGDDPSPGTRLCSPERPRSAPGSRGLDVTARKAVGRTAGLLRRLVRPNA